MSIRAIIARKVCSCERPADGSTCRAALDALIADLQQRRPGERAVLSRAIEIQGGLFRYGGVVESAQGECLGAALERIRILLTFAGVALR